MAIGTEKITERFLTEPESVYEQIDRLTDTEKRTLMELEEFFVGIQLENRLSADRVQPAKRDEAGLAWIVDALSAETEDTQVALDKLAAEDDVAPVIQELLYAKKAMEGERRNVPSYLMDMVRARSSGAAGALPAVVIRMAEDGLHVMKSALQGFLGLPSAPVTVRSAAATQERTARVELVQSLDDSSNQLIRYEVVREAEHSVTISISIPDQDLDYGINLRQDGRLVDARMVNGGEAIVVTFDHLTPGRYEVEFKGGISKTFPIHIEDV
jgi:hypothetical protein